MTADKQRTAIAEACGWGGFEGNGEFLIGVPPQNEITEKLLGPKIITNWTPRFDVPDYLNDLNAMHKAEKAIPKRDKCIYANHLMMVVGFDGETDMVDDYGEWSTSKTTSLFSILNATATQKAEAFLKTIGKWEE